MDAESKALLSAIGKSPSMNELCCQWKLSKKSHKDGVFMGFLLHAKDWYYVSATSAARPREREREGTGSERLLGCVYI